MDFSQGNTAAELTGWLEVGVWFKVQDLWWRSLNLQKGHIRGHWGLDFIVLLSVSESINIIIASHCVLLEHKMDILKISTLMKLISVLLFLNKRKKWLSTQTFILTLCYMSYWQYETSKSGLVLVWWADVEVFSHSVKSDRGRSLQHFQTPSRHLHDHRCRKIKKLGHGFLHHCHHLLPVMGHHILPVTNKKAATILCIFK